MKITKIQKLTSLGSQPYVSYLLCIPKEVREQLNWEEKDEIRVYVSYERRDGVHHFFLRNPKGAMRDNEEEHTIFKYGSSKAFIVPKHIAREFVNNYLRITYIPLKTGLHIFIQPVKAEIRVKT